MSLDTDDEMESLRERALIGLIQHHQRGRREAIRLFWQKLLAPLERLASYEVVGALAPMRYGLRTLMIVLAIGPPVLANAYFAIAPKSTSQRRQKGLWITGARFNGNRQYSDRKLAKVIGPEIGTGVIGFRLTPDLAEELRKKIEKLYHCAGYRHAAVKVRTGRMPHGRELIFDVREGTPIAQD
jgi:hypothetical protein